LDDASLKLALAYDSLALHPKGAADRQIKDTELV